MIELRYMWKIEYTFAKWHIGILGKGYALLAMIAQGGNMCTGGCQLAL